MWDTITESIMERATTLQGQTFDNMSPELGLHFTSYSLDPTYNVGPFYMTPVGFKNIFIEEEPLMISGFFTHTKKTELTYKILANDFFLYFPNMQNAKIAVTDC